MLLLSETIKLGMVLTVSACTSHMLRTDISTIHRTWAFRSTSVQLSFTPAFTQWKMFAQKTYSYVKLHEYEMILIKHQILHLLLMFVVLSQAHTFSCFANSSTACASFSLSIERRVDVILVCFYVSMLCSVLFWLLPKTYSEKFTSLKTPSAII